ncbi:MAG: hypothetical protein ACRD1O_02675 [Terriglobia bacterium]
MLGGRGKAATPRTPVARAPQTGTTEGDGELSLAKLLIAWTAAELCGEGRKLTTVGAAGLWRQQSVLALLALLP